MTALKQRVARLEQRVPKPIAPVVNTSKTEVFERWKELLFGTDPLLDPEECERVKDAVLAWLNDRAGPLDHWMRGLINGWSRLPKLSPEVMKRLLLAWLAPDCGGYSQVCTECGLQLPVQKSPPMEEWKLLPGKIPLVGEPPWYDLPEFFPTCPHCGASRQQRDWAHLASDKSYPWKALDGIVIVPRREC